MTPTLESSSVSRTAVTLAATVIILAGVRAAGAITVPFLLAFFIAAITAGGIADRGGDLVDGPGTGFPNRFVGE